MCKKTELTFDSARQRTKNDFIATCKNICITRKAQRVTIIQGTKMNVLFSWPLQLLRRKKIGSHISEEANHSLNESFNIWPRMHGVSRNELSLHFPNRWITKGECVRTRERYLSSLYRRQTVSSYRIVREIEYLFSAVKHLWLISLLSETCLRSHKQGNAWKIVLLYESNEDNECFRMSVRRRESFKESYVENDDS